jgi:hypothetical protein
MKIKTIAQKIDELIAGYKQLDREAHTMLDLYVWELRLQYPDMSIGVLKQMAIHNPAGSTLNVPRALQILKEKKCASR